MCVCDVIVVQVKQNAQKKEGERNSCSISLSFKFKFNSCSLSHSLDAMQIAIQQNQELARGRKLKEEILKETHYLINKEMTL